MHSVETKLPHIRTELPGPRARALLARDAEVVSPSYPRDYPFVMSHGRGAEVWDVDGNRFLDFAAGIAVCSTGHSHPKVVEAIRHAEALPEAQRVPPWEWRQGGLTRQLQPSRLEETPAAGFTCGAKRYCRDMESCEEARFYLERCGVSRLDGDGDGVPCEALCR